RGGSAGGESQIYRKVGGQIGQGFRANFSRRRNSLSGERTCSGMTGGGAMGWVTEEIAISDHRRAADAELLQREGIASILSLVGTLVGRSASSLGVKQLEILPLMDGPGDNPRRFGMVVGVLARLVAQAPPVLVHCRAGRSRSPAVVAA